MLFEFGLTFNQLIADLITTNAQNAVNADKVIREYQNFLDLLNTISKNCTTHLHTLNHDLLLEELSNHKPMRNNFVDGFEREKTPYFGEKYVDHHKICTPFPYFVNKYNKQFQLYKLHGSIDYYWFKDLSLEDLIRVKKGYSHNYMFKHIQVDAERNKIDCTDNFYPEFLSGTTNKIRQYSRGIYYPRMFEHFKNNLHTSSILIVIGYSFGDIEINKYIESNFASDDEKKLIIIDISEPEVGFIKSENTVFLDGGISGFDLKSSEIYK